MSMPSTDFHRGLMHPRHWLTWCGLFVFFLITRLPIGLLDKTGAFLGRVLHKKNKKRAEIVRINLQLCFPDKSDEEIDAMAIQHFELLMISLMHYGLIWWSDNRRLENLIERVGFEQIEQIYAENRNVIILLSHCTGLEFAVFAVASSSRGAGPYKPFPNPVIDWLILRSRAKYQCKPFRREDGLRPVIRYARDKLPIVYLADEDLGRDVSVFAPLFGHQKATIPVLGRLAKACNAEVLPAMACYDRQKHQYKIMLLEADTDFPLEDELQNATAMNRMIEQTISQCPLQYFWTMKFFKTRPEGEQSFY